MALPEVEVMFRLAALLLSLCVNTVSARGEDPAHAASRSAFVLQHRCSVAERLTFLRSLPDRKKGQRHLIIEAEFDMIGHFVQCLFNEAGDEMLCEAASGFYSAKSGQPRTWSLSHTNLDRVEAYGFDRDSSKGNHRQIVDLKSKSLVDVSEMMLGALHDVYAVRLSTSLRITAPLVKKAGFAPRCAPTS